MSEMNPHQPPVAAGATNDGFNPAGRSVRAAHGWTWISAAFTLFMQSPVLWILLLIGYLVCTLGVTLILLVPVFTAGLMLACRTLERGEPIDFGYLFAGFKERAGDLILVGVLAMIAFAMISVPAFLIVGGAGIFALLSGNIAGIAAMGVTILLVILVALAIMIPICMALWFAAPLIILQGLGAGQALKASFVGCLRNIIPFLLYGIVLHVFSWIAAGFTFGLGFLVLGPVAIASIYTAYRDIYYTA